MAIGDLPLLSAFKSKMQWHQARQQVLALNVANADTPHFKGRDLKKLTSRGGGAGEPFVAQVQMAQTDSGHLAGRPFGAGRFRSDSKLGFETTPNGNVVNLEEEMIKSAENQIDYQTVTSLYQRSIGVLKTAIGRRA